MACQGTEYFALPGKKTDQRWSTPAFLQFFIWMTAS